MLSPQLSVTTPDGANQLSSPRRRGLSYLRGLSQGRLSPGISSETPPRSSPRSYFARSISYHEPRSLAPELPRRRSASRPNETVPSAVSSAQDEAADTTNTADTTRPGSPSADNRQPRSSSRQEEGQPQSVGPETMARHRAGSSRRAGSTNESQNAPAEGETSTDRTQRPRGNTQPSTDTPIHGSVDSTEATETQKGHLPTIWFYPHQEIRNGRQSLNFTPVSRTLPNESSVLRVGRYSEREGIPTSNPTGPSDAPIGFKSKVVSRKHCEFSFVNGQWHVRDVASSSGTFLNHIRLSQPNSESRLFPVKDGDILQLGIDFRGGEEMIFRCVKIRIQCHRAWQKRLNNFNKTRHALLQNLSKDQPATDENSNECTICLGTMAPLQALFVAPCAHTWHYKCIRPIIEGKHGAWTQFHCPNCRAFADLSADVEIISEDMDETMDNVADGDQTNGEDNGNDQNLDARLLPSEAEGGNGPRMEETPPTPLAGVDPPQEVDMTGQGFQLSRTTSMSGSGLLARRQAANSASPAIISVNGIDLPDRFDADETNNDLEPERTRTESPDLTHTISGEGPLTPRNNAGPFVFDGSAGRAGARRLPTPMISEGAE